MDTIIFQIINTLLALMIFIGIPYYLIKRHKKTNQLEAKLLKMEERLKALEDHGFR